MKTTRIVSLIAATLSIVLATSVSAVPASKRIGTGKTSALSSSTTISPVEHTIMKRVGPMGKGYICYR